MSLEARVRDLEMSQRRLEDELEIRELLSLYGAYADCGRHDLYLELFTDDCAMELHSPDLSGPYGGVTQIEGKDAVAAFMADPRLHMSIQGRSVHLPTLNLRVRVEGDQALAESCPLVIVKEGADKFVFEAGFTRWNLRRVGGGWLIAKRTRYSLGADGYAPSLGPQGPLFDRGLPG